MAKFFDSLNDKLSEFIAQQKMFFVATAAPDGRINLSPKGYDALRIAGPTRLMWLNLSGSGNETAAHLRVANRMTLMFCSFTEKPLILRVYGSANTIHRRDSEWPEAYAQFGDYTGARQIFDMRIESVQTSCGYAVPFYDFVGERSTLAESADRKGQETIEQGWTTKNARSIDGLDTGITP